MAVKLTDLSKVRIEQDRGILVLTFECGQQKKVTPVSLIEFAERAIRQAKAAQDYEPKPNIQEQGTPFSVIARAVD